jgi:hypothetical protein
MTALDCQSEEKSQNEIFCEDDFLKDDNEEELALLSRRIQKWIQNKKKSTEEISI